MSVVLLDGLDDIDWKNYHHAYGTAEAVPGLLRAWLSHDDRDPEDVTDVPDLMFSGRVESTVSEQALMDIWGSVFHQSDVNSAAGPMAKFLLRIARDGTDHDKTHALEMLDLTLSGGRRYWEADGFDPQAHELPDAYAEAADAETLLAIVASDAAADLRIQAVNALIWLPRDAAQIAEVLRQRLDGADGDLPELASHMLLALAMAGRHLNSSADLDRFLVFEPAGNELAAINALALARIREVEVPGPVFNQLREALQANAPFPTNESRAPGPLGENFSHLVADAIVNSLLHPRGAEPGELLWRACLTDLEQAFGEYDSYVLQRLLAFHRTGRGEMPSHVRRVALTPADPGRNANDEFHMLAPSAQIHATQWTHIADDLIGLLDFGGQRIRIVSLDSLEVTGALTTEADPAAPPVVGRIDTTQVDAQLAGQGYYPREDALLNLAASPDGRWMAADSAGKMFIWDLDAKPEGSARSGPTAILEGFTPTRVQFAWSPDGTQLATVAAKQTHIWRAGEWTEPQRVIESGDLASLGWLVGNELLGHGEDHPAVLASSDGSPPTFLYSLRGKDEAILWMAADPAAGKAERRPGIIYTNPPENLIVYRWVKHDRPIVVTGDERSRYLETVRDPESIRRRLRGLWAAG